MRRRTRPTRRAFTLVELLVVVVIMGIISVSVLPAIRQNTEANIGAAADEVARYLASARGRAIAAGGPVGVRFVAQDSLITIVAINEDGDIETCADPVSQLDKISELAGVFPGVVMSSFTNGDGTTSVGTIWFDYSGVPHLRDADGDFAGVFTQNALVTLSSTRTIEVHAYTGMIERR